MPPAARISDPTNHPGAIAGPGAPNVLIVGLPAARVGDQHLCAMPTPAGPHPPNIVATGSATVLFAGMPAARMGDTTACGAQIIGGSPSVIVGG